MVVGCFLVGLVFCYLVVMFVVLLFDLVNSVAYISLIVSLLFVLISWIVFVAFVYGLLVSCVLWLFI